MTVVPVGPGPALATASTAPQRSSFSARLEARAAAAPSTPVSAASPAMSALASIDRAQARLDAVLAAARAGRTFTSAELIALQAEAYRCAQTVELASKLAEQGAQSVKQALNAQL